MKKFVQYSRFVVVQPVLFSGTMTGGSVASVAFTPIVVVAVVVVETVVESGCCWDTFDAVENVTLDSVIAGFDNQIASVVERSFSASATMLEVFNDVSVVVILVLKLLVEVR